MHSITKFFHSFMVAGFLAVFILASGSAEANTLRNEMRRLFNMLRTPLTVAANGSEDSRYVTDEYLSIAITRLADAQRPIRTLGSTSPSAANGLPEEDREAYRQAFKDRIRDLGLLIERLENAFRTQEELAPEERDFSVAGRIAEQIEICRDASHADFRSPTPIADLQPEACQLEEL